MLEIPVNGRITRQCFGDVLDLTGFAMEKNSITLSDFFTRLVFHVATD